MSTALLPAARRGVDRPLSIDDADVLDAVHDHVVRLLGDADVAAAVMADVALRAGDRANDGATRPTHTELLRHAHARMATEARVTPEPSLRERLAGDVVCGPALVAAMSVPGRTGAALLDLTTRHGLTLSEAASLVGLDRQAAAATRTEALQVVRARLIDAGVSMGVDVTSALDRLPVLPAAPESHDLFAPAARAPGRPVRPALAWLGTAVVGLGTVGALIAMLPSLTEAATVGDAPVVVAEPVSDTPAAQQLATPGDDVPEAGVEQLVVQAPERDAPEEQASDEQAAEPAPSPEPSPESEPTPEGDQGTAPEEPEDPEPSPEPSEDPLDLDLLDP